MELKGTYRATKWQVFKHRFGVRPRMCFMYRYPPYKNWISRKLWKFWYPNRYK